MTRREGTSKSNFMQSGVNCHDEDVEHRYALGPLQLRFSQNPPVRLERGQESSIELFISYPKMVSRCSRKFVFDISERIQGFGHGPIFGHDSHMRTFKWRFLASQLSYRAVEPRNDHFKLRRSWHLPREHATIWGWMKFWSFFGRIGLQILDIFSHFEHVSNFKHFSILNMMRTRIWCECEQADLLFEFHPEETHVEGLPRARSFETSNAICTKSNRSFGTRTL